MNKEHLLVLLFVSVAIAIRFFALSDVLWSRDAVDFALGLNSYDLSKYQPHPPGYPVYMILSKLFSIVLEDDIGGLRLTSVFFGAMTVLPFFYLVKQMYGKRVARLSSMLLIMNPLHWLMSTRALSDITGLFFVVLCVFFLYRSVVGGQSKTKKLHDLLIASFLLGMTLGVRMSYFPHLLLWAFVILCSITQVTETRDKIRMAVLPLVVFLGTTFIWALGQAMVVGYDTLFSEAIHFGRGHLMDWGGTVWTHPDLMSRFEELIIQNILMHGLGGGNTTPRLLVSVTAIASMLFFAAKEGLVFKVRFLSWWFIPYFIWVLMGQNLNNPRHVLALIPVLLIVIARGALHVSGVSEKALSYRSGLAQFRVVTRKLCDFCPVILVVTLSLISLRLAINNRQERSSTAQLVEFVKSQYDPTNTIIFCRETSRLFDYYAPNYITVNEKKVDIEGAVAFHAYGQPDVILVTSDLLDQWQREDQEGVSRLNFHLVNQFSHDAFLQNANHDLALYRLTA